MPCERTAGGHRRFDLVAVRRALDGGVTPPTLDELRRRRRSINRVANRHGLTNLRVFGSVSRGDAGPGSDLDLLVDASTGVTLLDVMGAEIDLENVLGVPVQIVTSGSRGIAAVAVDALSL